MSDLIKREDAVKTVIRKCSPICAWQVGTQQYPDCVVAEINALPSTNDNWIPVSERLPENKEETYWVCTDTEHQCECRWTNISPIFTYMTTDWHWNWFDIPQYTKVTAWQPLQTPYKESEVEE